MEVSSFPSLPCFVCLSMVDPCMQFNVCVVLEIECSMYILQGYFSHMQIGFKGRWDSPVRQWLDDAVPCS